MVLFFLGLGCLRESGQAGASRVGANTGELSNTGKEALTNGEADKKKQNYSARQRIWEWDNEKQIGLEG